MRCPACGFVSFDSVPACKRCGKDLPWPGKEDGVGAMARREGGPPRSPAGAVGVGLSPQDVGEVAGTAPAEAPAGEAVPADLASLRKAGFWLRSVALGVDAGLVAALATGGATLVGMAIQVGGLFSSPSEVGLEWLETVATRLLVVLVALCYFTLFVGWRGQTPGKMLLGLKIIRTTGDEVGYGRALVRWIGQGMSALLFGLGFLMVAFSRQKRALHDKLAGTCVVRLSH